MSQRRRLDFLKDYEFALSRKSFHMSTLMVKELELIEQFPDLSLVSVLVPSGVKLMMLKLTSNILEEIK